MKNGVRVTTPSPTWLFNGGTLTIAEGAAGESFTLNVGQERQGQAPGLISLQPSAANIVVDGANATLFIGENATFSKLPDSDCTITLNNGGKLTVGGLGKLVGSGTISGAVAGSALVEVDTGGELTVDDTRAPAQAYDLHVQTDFSMGDSATLSLGRCAGDLPLLEHREKRRQFHGESVVDRDALIGEACLGGGFLYTFCSS